ncbi:MAG: hypothetical protein CL878_06760 [Dehalococcoidia bacterium]|nr:hypothetical protein [Dehalococcoidia bacterium]
MLAGSTIGFGLALFVTAVALLLEVRTQVVAIAALSVFLASGLLGWFAEILFGPAIRSAVEEPDLEEEAAELSRRFPGAAAVIPEEALRGRSVDITFPAELGEQDGEAPPEAEAPDEAAGEEGSLAAALPEAAAEPETAPALAAQADEFVETPPQVQPGAPPTVETAAR